MKTIHVQRLMSIVDKSIGLLRYKEARPVYFTTRFGIHTFGMKFPIDVVVLDSEFKIIALTQRLAPNRIFLWSPRYYHVIELPAGEIQKETLTIGTKIIFE